MRSGSKRTIAGVVAGVAVLAGSGAALAHGGPGMPFGFGGGDDNQTALLNDVAKNLNVSNTALRKAVKDALKARVDQQVKDGVLTKAQGDDVKARIDSGAVHVGLVRGSRRRARRRDRGRVVLPRPDRRGDPHATRGRQVARGHRQGQGQDLGRPAGRDRRAGDDGVGGRGRRRRPDGERAARRDPHARQGHRRRACRAGARPPGPRWPPGSRPGLHGGPGFLPARAFRHRLARLSRLSVGGQGAALRGAAPATGGSLADGLGRVRQREAVHGRAVAVDRGDDAVAGAQAEGDVADAGMPAQLGAVDRVDPLRLLTELQSRARCASRPARPA